MEQNNKKGIVAAEVCGHCGITVILPEGERTVDHQCHVAESIITYKAITKKGKKVLVKI